MRHVLVILGFMLALVCGGIPVQAEGEKWWAFTVSATSHLQPPQYEGSWKRNYGAAWNFSTKDQAMAAAKKQCEQYGPRCFEPRAGRTLCFMIYLDSWGGYEHWVNDLYTAADVKRRFREIASWAVKQGHRDPQLEMYHCPTTGETWQSGK